MSKVGARKFYNELPVEKKNPAIEMLRNEIPVDDQDKMRSLAKENPTSWCVPYHFEGGMAVRNLLRTNGFNEDYWPIWNLDDIYVFLLEDAITKES